MDIEEARRIWGDDMSDEVLKEWLLVRNKRQEDPSSIPKGATIEIDTNTGKAIVRDDY